MSKITFYAAYFIFVFTLLITQTANAQLFDNGDIASEISSIVSNMPGDSGNNYSEPSQNQQDTWADMLDELFQADYADAANLANQVDYDLTIYSDQPSGETYYLLTSNNANYWGTYVFNPNYCRELVIQAPHPRKDFNTARQGIHVFRESESMLFMMAGTHRCNHSDPAGCSGSTRVCGEAMPVDYRISDLAHRTTTLFQRTTEELFFAFGGSYFLSLHGFTMGNGDPYVIMSNGTRQTPNPDYISVLANQLDLLDPVLTFEIGHINQNWDRLLGFTNTQGRLINGSNNHCSSNATTTDGRFLHIEQEKTRLRNNQSGWDIMAGAVINTFPCSVLPVQWQHFDVVENEKKEVVCEWTTSAETGNAHFELERMVPTSDWTVIAKIPGQGNTQTETQYSYTDTNPLPGSSYYRIRQVDFDGTSSVSEIREIKRSKAIQQIYPNPSNGLLQIQMDAHPGGELQVFNAMGQTVIHHQMTASPYSSTQTLDLSHLPDGWYWVAYQEEKIRILKARN